MQLDNAADQLDEGSRQLSEVGASAWRRYRVYTPPARPPGGMGTRIEKVSPDEVGRCRPDRRVKVRRPPPTSKPPARIADRCLRSSVDAGKPLTRMPTGNCAGFRWAAGTAQRARYSVPLRPIFRTVRSKSLPPTADNRPRGNRPGVTGSTAGPRSTSATPGPARFTWDRPGAWGNRPGVDRTAQHAQHHGPATLPERPAGSVGQSAGS